MFDNLTIGKKITLGFASILMLTVILSVTGVIQMRNVNEGVEDVADVHLPISIALRTTDAASYAQYLYLIE